MQVTWSTRLDGGLSGKSDPGTTKYFSWASPSHNTSFGSRVMCTEVMDKIVFVSRFKRLSEIRDITDLKQKITDAIATIDEAMLYSEHSKKSSTVLCFVQLMVPM